MEPERKSFLNFFQPPQMSIFWNIVNKNCNKIWLYRVQGFEYSARKRDLNQTPPWTQMLGENRGFQTVFADFMRFFALCRTPSSEIFYPDWYQNMTICLGFFNLPQLFFSGDFGAAKQFSGASSPSNVIEVACLRLICPQRWLFCAS